MKEGLRLRSVASVSNKALCVLLSLGLLSATCKRVADTAQTTLQDAVITGFDQRACPCCGGLMITFNGETQPYVQPFSLIENNADSLGILPVGPFPVRVRVAYTRAERCNQVFVDIKKLERR